MLHPLLSDPQRNANESYRPEASRFPGELSPPPGACFGRDGLIEKIVGLAENLTPFALIGTSGIGKTSIALAILHHPRVKKRFGDNRWFIRCDQFAASCTDLLSRLSRIIGANVVNPESLVPLRPFLSSKKMLIVLNNAEFVLDPQGANRRDIYEVVRELSQVYNICLCITSRITTIPPNFKCLNVPTLSMDAALTTFCHICDKDDRLDLVDGILEQLDFNPLSITLLATVAHQNGWDNGRLATEWEQGGTQVLQTDHNESLAAAIELSLASPTFKGLGPDARELLGIVAFLPQGVSESNLDWLFPTIPNKAAIFNKFCTLLLTHRSNGFFTMLTPLRDYLAPRDPMSSPLLCAIRDHYLTWVSIIPHPSQPGFEASRWIVCEDVNVEHILDVFTSACPDSVDLWRACDGFMEHLFWHKRRYTILGPKIEGLPNDHPAKPWCLHRLSQLFKSIGNRVNEERLLVCALELWKERGDEIWVARTLRGLSGASKTLGRLKEAIQYAKEALEILQRLGDPLEQVDRLLFLAQALHDDDQLDAAKETAFQVIALLPEKGQEPCICASHRLLGDIYCSKGEREKAIHHLEIALGIASQFNWHHRSCWINYSLAELFHDKGEFGKANSHVEQAKSHAEDHTYDMGRAIELQAEIWYQQNRLEEAMSETVRGIEMYKRLGLARDVGRCSYLLRDIEKAMGSLSTSEDSDSDVYETPPSSPT